MTASPLVSAGGGGEGDSEPASASVEGGGGEGAGDGGGGDGDGDGGIVFQPPPAPVLSCTGSNIAFGFPLTPI